MLSAVIARLVTCRASTGEHQTFATDCCSRGNSCHLPPLLIRRACTSVAPASLREDVVIKTDAAASPKRSTCHAAMAAGQMVTEQEAHALSGACQKQRTQLTRASRAGAIAQCHPCAPPAHTPAGPCRCHQSRRTGSRPIARPAAPRCRQPCSPFSGTCALRAPPLWRQAPRRAWRACRRRLVPRAALLRHAGLHWGLARAPSCARCRRLQTRLCCLTRRAYYAVSLPWRRAGCAEWCWPDMSYIHAYYGMRCKTCVASVAHAVSAAVQEAHGAALVAYFSSSGWPVHVPSPSSNSHCLASPGGHTQYTRPPAAYSFKTSRAARVASGMPLPFSHPRATASARRISAGVGGCAGGSCGGGRGKRSRRRACSWWREIRAPTVATGAVTSVRRSIGMTPAPTSAVKC